VNFGENLEFDSHFCHPHLPEVVLSILDGPEFSDNKVSLTLATQQKLIFESKFVSNITKKRQFHPA